ncbi:MAG: LytTR family transcriptional regulator, partial [Lachnospiraceae bacterium]|nr:LytTR family transcriptional regulator [Lachnospiraceae bacterium]
MTDMIEIEVVLDETCIEPKVKIFTKSETSQVEDIIYAIENRSRSSFAPIPVNENGKYMVISQRDIYRIRTQGREVLLDTQDRSYSVRGTIAKFEMELDQERFFR